MRALLLVMMSILALAAFSLPAAADACQGGPSQDCRAEDSNCAAADNSRQDDDGCDASGCDRCDGCYLPCCAGLIGLTAAGAELAPNGVSLPSFAHYHSGFSAAASGGIDRPPRN